MPFVSSHGFLSLLPSLQVSYNDYISIHEAGNLEVVNSSAVVFLLFKEDHVSVRRGYLIPVCDLLLKEIFDTENVK